MNLQEMSNEFDIWYNQVNSNQAPSIDEYEKSVFLTLAEHEIIKAYFDPRGNKFQEGFDLGLKRQYDFSTLIVNQMLNRVTVYSNKYDPRSLVYKFPEEVFLVLNESVFEDNINNTGIKCIYQVRPISYADYTRLMTKPYQYPSKRVVWRLITDLNTIANIGEYDPSQPQTRENNPIPTNTAICELIGKFQNEDNVVYKIRYVKKPKPIILVDLNDDWDNLSIDGISRATPCELPEGLHREIVMRAVELATATYNPLALGNIVGVGNASATNLGIIPSNNDRQ